MQPYANDLHMGWRRSPQGTRLSHAQPLQLTRDFEIVLLGMLGHPAVHGIQVNLRTISGLW
jgi:hypothetical protein